MKGIVQTQIAAGRRELAWEVGYSAQSGQAPNSAVIGITTANDADFVAKRLWLTQFGTNKPIDPSVTVQIQDSTTGNQFFRQAGNIMGMASSPVVAPASAAFGFPWGKAARNALGLPAPYIIRKASTVFFQITNPSAITFGGDLYASLEGYRVYPGQPDDVPAQIDGYTLPAEWNGTLKVNSSATNAVANLGLITMPGLGGGNYLLKSATLFTSVSPSVDANDLYPGSYLGIQLWTSRNASKRLVHVTSPSSVGDFMPVSHFDAGGTSFAWPQPIFVSGTDTIFAQIYGNTTWFTGNTPGTIELQLSGVCIPS